MVAEMVETGPGVRVSAQTVGSGEKAAEHQRRAELTADAARVPSEAASLIATSHESRKAAVAHVTIAAEEQRDRRLVEVRSMEGAAHATYRTTVANAEQVVAGARAKVAAKLADDLERDLPTIAAKLEVDPVACARELTTAWQSFKARTKDEIGDFLDPRHLAHAFATAQGRADHIGDRGFFSYGTEGVAAASTRLNDAIAIGHTISVRRCCEDLSAAVHTARATPHAARARALRRALTAGEMMRAMDGAQ